MRATPGRRSEELAISLAVMVFGTAVQAGVFAVVTALRVTGTLAVGGMGLDSVAIGRDSVRVPPASAGLSAGTFP